MTENSEQVQDNCPNWKSVVPLDAKEKEGILRGKKRYLRNSDIFGKGGKGEVYEVYDKKLDIVVLAKRGNTALGQKRMKREAKTLGKLSQKTRSVPRIYDTLEDSEGTNWIIMEKIEGVSLDEYLRNGDFDSKGVLNISRKLAKTLLVAEKEEILHRDFTPDNIIINKKGDPVIIDFGLSNLVQPDKNTQIGVLEFSSPEVRGGDAYTLQSEIYSFGTVVLEMQGRLPDSRTSGELRKVWDKATQYDPENRYQSFGEALEDLEKIKPEQKKEGKGRKALDRLARILRIK